MNVNKERKPEWGKKYEKSNPKRGKGKAKESFRYISEEERGRKSPKLSLLHHPYSFLACFGYQDRISDIKK